MSCLHALFRDPLWLPVATAPVTWVVCSCLFECHSPEPLVHWWPTVHGISLLGSPRPPRLCSPAELETLLARLFGAWETLAGPHGRVLGKQPRPVQALLPILLPRLPQLSETLLHPPPVCGNTAGMACCSHGRPLVRLEGRRLPTPNTL